MSLKIPAAKTKNGEMVLPIFYDKEKDGPVYCLNQKCTQELILKRGSIRKKYNNKYEIKSRFPSNVRVYVI